MSHITTVALQIPDSEEHLQMLAEAGQECGLQFMKDQPTHAWYGRFMGDSKPPGNMDPEKYGQCEHALRVIGGDKHTYEIGLVRDTQTGNFILAFDYWNRGRGVVAHGPFTDGVGLIDRIGSEAVKLRNLYCEKVAEAQMRTLQRQGWRITRYEEGGKVRHRATR